MQYKYVIRAKRRRVTKPLSIKQVFNKWKKKHAHLIHNNPVQSLTEAQSKDAKDLHNSLVASGYVLVQDDYYPSMSADLSNVEAVVCSYGIVPEMTDSLRLQMAGRRLRKEARAKAKEFVFWLAYSYAVGSNKLMRNLKRQA